MKKFLLTTLAVVCLIAGASAQRLANGSLTAAAASCTSSGPSCVIMTFDPSSNDAGAVGVDVSSIPNATVVFEASFDGKAIDDSTKTWRSVSVTPVASTTTVTSTTSAGAWRVAVSGMTDFRVRCSVFTTGPVVLTIRSSQKAASLGGGGSGTVTFSSGGTTANVLPKGTGVANTLADSSITDDATTVSTPENVSITGTGTLSIASNGTASAPFLVFTGAGSNYGWFWDTTYQLTLAVAGTGGVTLSQNGAVLKAAGRFGWNADTKSNNTGDTFLERKNPGIIYAAATADTADGTLQAAAFINGVPANGQQESCSWNSELLTLSTSGTTTDTSANLLPANSVIKEVLARVTTTITTATSWQLGDPTTAGRFTTANATMTSGTTDIGKVFMTTGIASATTGIWQAAAAKVRVTTVGTPGAGAIRIAVLSCVYTPPTS